MKCFFCLMAISTRGASTPSLHTLLLSAKSDQFLARLSSRMEAELVETVLNALGDDEVSLTICLFVCRTWRDVAKTKLRAIIPNKRKIRQPQGKNCLSFATQ